MPDCVGVLKYGLYSVRPALPESSGLIGYCDADYAGDTDTRKSTSGYIFILHWPSLGVVSARQQLQPQPRRLSTWQQQQRSRKLYGCVHS
eukprot:jgi/Chrzof1/5486/Cz16g05030.t1